MQKNIFIAGIIAASILLSSLTNATPPENPKKTTADQETLDIPNLSTPIKGLLVGGQPTIADISKIKEFGFTTIISLRPKDEEKREVAFDEEAEVLKQGIKFIRIPIADKLDLNDKKIQLLDMALAEASGKVFVHCRTGNRVGAMLALRAFKMQNISISEAIELGEKAGLNTMLEDVKEKMTSPEKPN